jgi:dihydropteroate synthase
MSDKEVPGVNRSHGPPRVVELRGARALREEMTRMRVDPAGIEIMVPKGEWMLVRVKDMGYAQAGILKQEMLSLGGECAHARGVVTAQSETTDVLLMGSRRHFTDLSRKLAVQPFGLADLAGDVGDAVERFSGREPAPMALGGAAFEWGRQTYVMGILNVTPDSFSDGGEHRGVEAAVAHAAAMAEAGAHIIDIGGESTRPGSDPVSAEEEMERVLPVLERVVKDTGAPVSVDTRKAKVAEEALKLGAVMVNDVTAMRGDPEMARTIAGSGAAVVLMHMLGEPRTMQEAPAYADVMEEVYLFLAERRDAAVEAGIDPGLIFLDPGIGFGKRLEDNMALMARLGELRCLGHPIVVGPSRKQFIGDLSGAQAGDRVPGTLAAVAAASFGGAHVVRVHDVAGTVQALAVADGIARGARRE